MRISEGKAYPLGATADANGANFALFSANATRVDVCLFDADGRADATPLQSSVERQTDLTTEQQSKGSSGHLHAIGRLLDQTSADALSSQ